MHKGSLGKKLPITPDFFEPEAGRQASPLEIPQGVVQRQRFAQHRRRTLDPDFATSTTAAAAAA
eukprot:CAMPEP_0175153142 /NCGR_PEP_ID=MMETSP0087-20121206/19551_1 /TAXON_ID=136419 /ORGANISM="Unknown Unknown, Strain D1" /LENGTH=63 /DNA_ID=CAMNT_0016439745 /DNA_START=55 /DNA_END=242 /DNA_ORIENTATION=+